MHFVLFTFLGLFGFLSAQPLELTVNAESAILINGKTGRVLFAKNEHSPAFPASTTKIATALFALQKCQQEDLLFVAERESIASITPQAKKQSNYRSPPHWLETDGTHVGIKRGEELKFKDLLHALLIASANDAANVIAQGLGKTIPNFMEEMNLYLQEIGCKNTNYNNPHGLHHPAHITTAYDLSLMAKEALKDPIFREIVARTSYTLPKTNLELERHCVQTNQLLKKGTLYYQKAIGVKTGFTQTSGKNLVAAAVDGDRLLIAVALGYKGARSELYLDVIKMFETAFNEPEMRRTLMEAGEQKITKRIAGASSVLKTHLPENLSYDFYPSEESPVKAVVSWEIPRLPIAQDARVGLVKIIDIQGNVMSQVPLLALNEVKPTLWRQTKSQCSGSGARKLGFVITSALILFFGWRFLRKPKRSRNIM